MNITFIILSSLLIFSHITPLADTSSAIIRQGTKLSPHETKALSKRLPKVKQHLEKVLKKKLPYNHVPNIMLLTSGGGYRAMIASLGFLRGVKKIGLFDSSCYVSTLSGSSWMYTAWLRHKVSLKCFTAMLKKKVSTSLFETPINFTEVSEILMRKIYNGQPVTLVDFWGALIGNMLFSDISSTGKDVFLSDLVNIVKKGDYPLPILTSVSPQNNNYIWFEHTPWEVGSADYGYFVPTPEFNSLFNAGIATNVYPEPTCGFHLGVCGSAFAVTAKDLFRIYKNEIADETLLKALEDIVNDLDLENIRVTKGKINNFMQHLSPQDIPQDSTIELIDAGIDIELPLEPVIRRYADILVICDASSDSPTGLALQQTAAYAQQHNFPFPVIPTGTIDPTIVSVFVDEANPKTPIVIYIPNEKDYSLFKFDYSNEEFEGLYGAMKVKVENNANIMWRAISQKVEQLEMLYP